MRLVVLLVYFIDGSHRLYSLRLEVSRRVPLPIMRSFGLDSRLRGWVIYAKLDIASIVVYSKRTPKTYEKVDGRLFVGIEH
jgi:hypothetical protein